MPRGIDMRHDMDRPASLPRFVRAAAGVHRHRIEAAADAGIGAEQRDRAELALGFLDDAEDVLLPPDIAFEGGAIDGGGHRLRAGFIEIDDHDLGGAGAMEFLAQRLADAVGAAGDHNDLARHLHRHPPSWLAEAWLVAPCYLRPEPDPAPPYNGIPRPKAQSRARSRSGSAAVARRGRSRRGCRGYRRRSRS